MDVLYPQVAGKSISIQCFASSSKHFEQCFHGNLFRICILGDFFFLLVPLIFLLSCHVLGLGKFLIGTHRGDGGLSNQMTLSHTGVLPTIEIFYQPVHYMRTVYREASAYHKPTKQTVEGNVLVTFKTSVKILEHFSSYIQRSSVRCAPFILTSPHDQAPYMTRYITFLIKVQRNKSV